MISHAFGNGAGKKIFYRDDKNIGLIKLKKLLKKKIFLSTLMTFIKIKKRSALNCIFMETCKRNLIQKHTA